VHRQAGDVEVIQQSGVELCGIGGTEKNHDFLIGILFEEGIQK
jgi:hypothetical protein